MKASSTTGSSRVEIRKGRFLESEEEAFEKAAVFLVRRKLQESLKGRRKSRLQRRRIFKGGCRAKKIPG